VVLIVAFLVALVMTPAAMGLARRTGLLDRPGPLKIQQRPVPYLGGLAVAAGLAVAVITATPLLAVPLGAALILGVVDDADHIKPLLRLAVEAAIGIATAAVLPTRIGGPLGWILVTLVVVAVINGVNMIDGLDALAAGVALACAVGFAVVLDGDGRTLALGLTGALAAFLLFNRPPARIYLGDGGAYLIGAALASLLVLAWAPKRPIAVSVGSLALVACPVGELALTVLRRRWAGRPLSTGDRDHVYDQLVRRGWSRNRSVAAYVLAQSFLVAIGASAVHLSPAVAAASTAALGLTVVVIMRALDVLTPTHPETAA
jgi:UDP-GlcNAc:undecaprenyl-phosphate GlcNAc-1-phosphate transferase